MRPELTITFAIIRGRRPGAASPDLRYKGCSGAITLNPNRVCENTVHAILSALGSSYDVASQVLTLAHAVHQRIDLHRSQKRSTERAGPGISSLDPLAGEDICLGISPQPNGPGKHGFPIHSTHCFGFGLSETSEPSSTFDAFILRLLSPISVHIIDIGQRSLSVLPNFACLDGPRRHREAHNGNLARTRS